MRMEEAIASGNTEDLRALWEYIKGRRRRLRTDLQPDEQQVVDEFIRSKRNEFVLVLSRGDLETYLPVGHRAKDLEKLIQFVNADFWPQLEAFAQEELSQIVDTLKRLGA